MLASRLLLYDTQWQCLRVGMLKQYSPKGGWQTYEGTLENLRKLRQYISQAPDETDKMIRLWRVINALNAVRMGYSGSGKTGSQEDETVRKFRDYYSPEYEALCSQEGVLELPEEFEHFEEQTILELKNADHSTICMVYCDLNKRRRNHKEREELNWYLTLIETFLEYENACTPSTTVTSSDKAEASQKTYFSPSTLEKQQA